MKNSWKNVLNECITDDEINNMLQDNILCDCAPLSVMYQTCKPMVVGSNPLGV